MCMPISPSSLWLCAFLQQFWWDWIILFYWCILRVLSLHVPCCLLATWCEMFISCYPEQDSIDSLVYLLPPNLWMGLGRLWDAHWATFVCQNVILITSLLLCRLKAHNSCSLALVMQLPKLASTSSCLTSSGWACSIISITRYGSTHASFFFVLDCFILGHGFLSWCRAEALWRIAKLFWKLLRP